MKTKRRLTIAGIVAGSLLTLSPVFGILATVLGMGRAFATLGKAGVSDPRELATGIGETLMTTAVGFFLFPVGVLLLTLSIVFYFRLKAASPPPVQAA
ncbi:hypothetical protein BH09VER1_BH09VER1_55060 [soil metagenome]